MKIFFSSYSLNSKRMGALIKLEEKGTIGFADLHPWPELGDEPLEAHLKNQDSTLWKRALYFARIDGEARFQGKSLLKSNLIPKSHYLMTRIAKFDIPDDFKFVKIKVGRNCTEEIHFLIKHFKEIKDRNLKLRLDFNNYLSEMEFNQFIGEIEDLHPFIDFIEDPFTFDIDRWVRSARRWGLKFALDHESEKGIGFVEAAPILIVKPARQSEIPFFKAKDFSQKLIVTSSLDHPLGQAAAAFIASKFPLEVSGLLSHKVYPINRFSSLIETAGPHFKIPRGTGLGFDDLLKNVVWQELELLTNV